MGFSSKKTCYLLRGNRRCPYEATKIFTFREHLIPQKKLYHIQNSEIFTSSKNDNLKNCRTTKNVFYIFQGLLVDDMYRHQIEELTC